MIAYEELVVALTNWRINQGLPTSAVTFLSQDTGSVDLALPVADPLAAAQEVQELDAEEYDGEELASEEYEGEELASEEYGSEEVAEELASEEYAGEEMAEEGYAPEEVATDTYAAEGAAAEEGMVDPALNYDDDTQYVGAPDELAETESPPLDQTQEMTIQSISDEDEQLEAAVDPSTEEALHAAEEEPDSAPATEEVPMLTDEDAAEMEAQAAEEVPMDAVEEAEDEQAPVEDAEDDVEFGDAEEVPLDPATEIEEPGDSAPAEDEELDPPVES